MTAETNKAMNLFAAVDPLSKTKESRQEHLGRQLDHTSVNA